MEVCQKMEQWLKKQILRKIPTISKLILLVGSFYLNTLTFASQEISIVISDNHYQRSLGKAIVANIDKYGISTKITDIKNTDEIDNKIIIGIGNEANSALDHYNTSAPQLRLVTSITREHAHATNKTIYLSMTQAACQQFTFINAIDSQWKKIGILLKTSNKLLIKELEQCAQKNNQTVTPIIIDQHINIIDALNSNLPTTDVLLALPDTDVYNSKTIKSILLTTYRHRKPLIGFSSSFVRAGALTAMHSSIEQLGKQAAEIAVELYKNNHVKQQYFYPEYFDIETNKEVARSLGIDVPDSDILIEKIKQTP